MNDDIVLKFDKINKDDKKRKNKRKINIIAYLKTEAYNFSVICKTNPK